MPTKIQKQIAEVFRIGLSCSVGERVSVVAWADEVILANADFDYGLIEIATSDALHIIDLIGKLTELAIGCDHHAAIRTVMGRMYVLAQQDKEKLSQFAQGLDFAIANKAELPDDLVFCASIADEYSLASCGIYGNLNDVETDFMEALKVHWYESSVSNKWYISLPV